MDETARWTEPSCANPGRLLNVVLVLLFAGLCLGAGFSQLPVSGGPAGPASPAGPQGVSQFPGDATDGPPLDQVNYQMAEKRRKIMNIQRQTAIVNDSNKLLKLATELNNEVARENRGALSSEQMKKLAEIEKLAHSVKEKMTTPSPELPVNQNFPPSFPSRP
jgi:hypothetical protein